jgi:hypothetical protein
MQFGCLARKLTDYSGHDLFNTASVKMDDALKVVKRTLEK